MSMAAGATRSTIVGGNDATNEHRRNRPPKPLKATPPPKPAPVKPQLSKPTSVSVPPPLNPPTLPPRGQHVEETPRRASIPLPVPPRIEDHTIEKSPSPPSTPKRTLLGPPLRVATPKQPQRVQSPPPQVRPKVQPTVQSGTQVSWQFPSDLPDPPQHSGTSKEYPAGLKHHVQLIKLVSQCPKPPKQSAFEQQLQQLTKKTDQLLNLAIKQQDFAQCMDLKGRLEVLRFFY